MTADNESDLVGQLDSLNTEIANLRKELNEVNRQKEEWFNKKKELQKQIFSSVSQIRNSKKNRNILTDQVKESKKRRDELNQQIKDKIEHLKNLRNEKEKVLSQHKIKIDPMFLKNEIDQIEHKIETEGLTFKKEQEFMKIINGKKKQLKEIEKVSAIFASLSALSKEIDALKKKADETHKKVKAKADESQEKHETAIELSKDVDTFRKSQKEIDDKCTEYKKKFSEMNDALQVKMIERAKLQEKVGVHERPEKKKPRRMSIEERAKEIEERFKKGGKLTTEDILALQMKR